MNSKLFLFLFLFNLIGYGFLANNVGHEFGHIVLNEGRWSGRICVLGCDGVETVNGFSGGGAWVELVEPFTDLTKNEYVVELFGAGLCLLSCLGFGGAFVLKTK